MPRAALQLAGVNPMMPLAGGLGSDQKQPLSIGCQAAALAAFCTFLTIVGLTVFLIFCLPPIAQVIAAQSWMSVPCRVVSSGVSASRGRRGTYYHIDVVYTYSYNGRSYQSDRYRFRQLISAGGNEEKEQVVQRLSAGSSANCF